MEELDIYIEDCKRHLEEFASEDDKNKYHLYTHSYEEVLENKDYFDKCRIGWGN